MITTRATQTVAMIQRASLTWARPAKKLSRRQTFRAIFQAMASNSAPPAPETSTTVPGRRSDTPAPSAAQAAPPEPAKPESDLIGGAARSVGEPAGRLRARTLIVLRWMAIAGQLGAVLATGLVLRFPVPY